LDSGKLHGSGVPLERRAEVEAFGAAVDEAREAAG
jgi:hypothetical protein